MRNLAAWTDMDNPSLPDYVSVNEDAETGQITLTARGDGVTIKMRLPPLACRHLALSLARVPLQ